MAFKETLEIQVGGGGGQGVFVFEIQMGGLGGLKKFGNPGRGVKKCCHLWGVCGFVLE